MKTFKPANACLARYFTVLLLGLILSAGVNSVRAQDNVETLRDGLRIKFGQVQVELTAATPDALRLSVANGKNPRFIPDTFLAGTKATNSVAWRAVKRNGMVGIRTKAGELLINPANGEWTLLDAREKVLIPPYEPGRLNQAASPESDAVNISLGWNGRGPVTAAATTPRGWR